MRDSWRIGVLSDTHGLLRPQVKEILKECDYIIHGGDMDKEEILRELETIAPVFAVRGNNDRGEWADRLEETLRFSIGHTSFLVVHNKACIPDELNAACDVIIFGHSHRYFCEEREGTLWLNPGSCGRRRFHLELSMAVIRLSEAGVQVDKVEIEA